MKKRVTDVLLSLSQKLGLDTDQVLDPVLEGERDIEIEDIEYILHELGHVSTLSNCTKEKFFQGEIPSLNAALIADCKRTDQNEIAANAISLLAAKSLFDSEDVYQEMREIVEGNAPNNLFTRKYAKNAEDLILRDMVLKANRNRADWILRIVEKMAETGGI